MFRDSHGVVHTLSSSDPLHDLPTDAAQALQRALLRPVDGDIGGALERCDAVRELLERWQDAFFAALPDDVDPQEEARWAAEAGVALQDIEDSYDDEEEGDEDEVAPVDETDAVDPMLDLDLLLPVSPGDDPRAGLPEELVSVLERELLLLPLRVRLEALVAAADLVDGWAELLADHEKLLGHLVLAHGEPLDGTASTRTDGALGHEALADRHASRHAGTGPRHATEPGAAEPVVADPDADHVAADPDADAGP